MKLPALDRLRYFHQSTIARIASPHSAVKGSLAYWRASILSSMLLTALLVGSFATASGIAVAVKESAWGLVIFDLFAYGICLWLIFSNRLAYEVRASITLLMCFAVGLAVILAVGPLSGGAAWLFSFAVLVGILLGSKHAVVAILLNTVSLSLVGWLISSGRFGAEFPFFRTSQAMLAAGINFITLNAVVSISVAMLVKGLVATYQNKAALATQLVKEHKALLAAKRELEAEIHERRQAQKALGESEQRFRAFIENAPMAMYTINPQGEFQYGNKKLLEITGYQIRDWLYKPFHPIVHPDDLPLVIEKVQRRIQGRGSPEPYEIRIFHASGAVMWVEIVSESIFASKGTNAGTLTGMQSFLTDITQRKQAEQALRESEARYRHLFELESDAIFLIHKETGQILEANEAAASLYGYSRAELLTMRNVDLSGEPEKTIQATRAHLNRVPMRYHRKKDGTVFPVEITASHLTWKGHEAHIAAIRDTSFRVEAEAQRLRLEKELFQARKMESIGTLAGGIAHDFNNILYMIIGNTELAIEDLNRAKPLRAYLETILNAGLKASGIVKQLLKFSHQSTPELKPTDGVAAIRDALEFIRASIPATVAMHTDLPAEQIVISADPIQIQQVMMNICSNAAQAMAENGGELRIGIELVTPGKRGLLRPRDDVAGDYLRIQISDTGPGIAPEFLERVFDPYFTTKDVGQGTGMGLAVVHGIVSKHGGSITARNQPNGGAAFTVLLPVIEEPPAVETETAEIVRGGRESILLVDDEAALALMTGQTLERMGYRVETATDPAAALERFKAAPDAFDLIITDMTMPGLTGIALAEQIRRQRFEIPIILCTGHGALMDREQAQQAGIAAFLIKPVVKSDLARTIRNILDQQPTSACVNP